jgi:hypothetical protein
VVSRKGGSSIDTRQKDRLEILAGGHEVYAYTRLLFLLVQTSIACKGRFTNCVWENTGLYWQPLVYEERER